ncbi:hypothetical protein Dsin_020614 [Dipteronia sinensis]|uniref:Uncharacterized protein n=1 Tax=Dipteronia sinensis TaxID=43782 RepID=A0AAE0AAS1_9ROSI|nr:hypothetical protein Dsin_020614 [Dipteronia sinensis]
MNVVYEHIEKMLIGINQIKGLFERFFTLADEYRSIEIVAPRLKRGFEDGDFRMQTQFQDCSGDMGCHIDGFIAVMAHTHVLQDGPVKGRQQTLLLQPTRLLEVALRLNDYLGKRKCCVRCFSWCWWLSIVFSRLRFHEFFESLSTALSQNKDITDAIQKVDAAYDCKIVEGVKQFVFPAPKPELMMSNLKKMKSMQLI